MKTFLIVLAAVLLIVSSAAAYRIIKQPVTTVVDHAYVTHGELYVVDGHRELDLVFSNGVTVTLSYIPRNFYQLPD